MADSAITNLPLATLPLSPTGDTFPLNQGLNPDAKKADLGSLPVSAAPVNFTPANDTISSYFTAVDTSLASRVSGGGMVSYPGASAALINATGGAANYSALQFTGTPTTEVSGGFSIGDSPRFSIIPNGIGIYEFKATVSATSNLTQVWQLAIGTRNSGVDIVIPDSFQSLSGSPSVSPPAPLVWTENIPLGPLPNEGYILMGSTIGAGATLTLSSVTFVMERIG